MRQRSNNKWFRGFRFGLRTYLLRKRLNLIEGANYDPKYVNRCLRERPSVEAWLDNKAGIVIKLNN